MQRDKYPEKVPFRLTRMLIHAMEVCGITGTFSRSCEVSMEVLRANKESLMAVLEAFVYDPLINWRLTAGATQGGRQQATHDVEERGGQPYGVQRNAGRADERDILLEADRPEVMNDKALQVIERVRRKLTGEFGVAGRLEDDKGTLTARTRFQAQRHPRYQGAGGGTCLPGHFCRKSMRRLCRMVLIRKYLDEIKLMCSGSELWKRLEVVEMWTAIKTRFAGDGGHRISGYPFGLYPAHFQHWFRAA